MEIDMRKVLGPGSMSVWFLKEGAEQKAESNHCVIKSSLMERDVHTGKVENKYHQYLPIRGKQ